MQIISHGYRFRNTEEREFYFWLRRMLGEDIRILHNFFYFDVDAGDFREVDFLIITKKLFVIEHKTSCHRAYSALEKLMPIRLNLWNYIQQREDKLPEKKPWVEYAVVCNNATPQTHRTKLPDDNKNRIFHIPNERELENTIGASGFIDKKGTIQQDLQETIVRALACQEFKFSPLTDDIFQIFDDFIQWKKLLLENNIKERDFWSEKLPIIYNHFQSLDYILCTAFLDIEKRLQGRKKKGPSLNYHRPSAPSIRKLRPVYWGCATTSESPDYEKHLQLSVHISRGPWMHEARDAVSEDHIAIKLSFFRSIDAEVLRRIKRNIYGDPGTYLQLLRELKKQDPLFTFYRSVADRNHRVRIDDFDEIGELIADELISYDEDGNEGFPVPRSTEFVKFVQWKEVWKRFQRADSAIDYVKGEISKLLSLFNFLNS